MKVELFRNREGKVVAAAEIGAEGSVRSRFEPLETKTAGAKRAVAAPKAPEIVEADLSDPEAFFRKYQR
jgi:hypothetical protein